MLLPLFARLFVLNDDPNAMMRFNGTVLVPIDGVDFRPYVEILLRAYEGDALGRFGDTDELP